MPVTSGGGPKGRAPGPGRRGSSADASARGGAGSPPRIIGLATGSTERRSTAGSTHSRRTSESCRAKSVRGGSCGASKRRRLGAYQAGARSRRLPAQPGRAAQRRRDHGLLPSRQHRRPRQRQGRPRAPGPLWLHGASCQCPLPAPRRIGAAGPPPPHPLPWGLRSPRRAPPEGDGSSTASGAHPFWAEAEETAASQAHPAPGRGRPSPALLHRLGPPLSLNSPWGNSRRRRCPGTPRRGRACLARGHHTRR
jgi:hypothetical protein